MKIALLTASLVLLGGTLTACGDDSDGGGADGGSDDTVSTAEFCGAITDVQEAYAQVDPENLAEEDVRGVKDAVADLADLGLPEDVTDEEREGFELIADAIADLPDDATIEDLSIAGENFSDEDEAKSDAFDDFVEETCVESGSEESPESEATE
ncbi:MAG: hypothetical protein Q8O61_03940 [Nocardioides sp.]|nr:hypothetical protein [Nocardioides sp.]